MKRANLDEYQREMDSYYLEFDRLIGGIGEYLSDIKIPVEKKTDKEPVTGFLKAPKRGILRMITNKKRKKDSGNSNFSLPDTDTMISNALSPCKQAFNLYKEMEKEADKLVSNYERKLVFLKKKKIKLLQEDKKEVRKRFTEFCRISRERIGSFESKINVFQREYLISEETSKGYLEFVDPVKKYLDKIKPAY